MKTYSLLALTGPLGGKSFPLPRGSITIGRLPGQTIRLPDETVSRNHAVIRVSWLGCSITDLQSVNGTYVNGERVGRRRLRVGDRIRIGRCEFVLNLADRGAVFAPPPSTAPEPLGEELYTRQAIRSISIVGVIGKSPFSTVYEARAHPSGERAAVKVPSSQVRGDPNCLLRFKREARNCLKLKHRNIVRSLATGELADGLPFLVMEYLPGETVRDIIDRRGMTPDLFRSIVASVADALAYAHAQGIVHRDIKPDNVKADGSGIFKIMDFGIARVLGEASFTMTGMVLGTPYYMAPEQALGQPVDPRTDIYAFGVMLYELVTLRVPFSGDAIEVLKKHIHYDPIPPRKVNPHLSLRTERAILRAMRKNPRERFSSVLELKEEVLGADHGLMEVPLSRTSVFAGRGTLTVAEGPYGVGTVIPLPRSGILTLGRAIGNSVSLPWDHTLSIRHARILCSGGAYVIEDLASNTGTWVNRSRITRRRLESQDRIRIGRTVFMFM